MIDIALTIGFWIGTALTVTCTPLAVWLAWKNRWQPEDGRGGQEWPDVIVPDDPGGLSIDWDAELRALFVDA